MKEHWCIVLCVTYVGLLILKELVHTFTYVCTVCTVYIIMCMYVRMYVYGKEPKSSTLWKFLFPNGFSDRVWCQTDPLSMNHPKVLTCGVSDRLHLLSYSQYIQNLEVSKSRAAYHICTYVRIYVVL